MSEDNMEGTNLYNYSSCCRLCLMDNINSLKPIFDDATERQSLVEKIFDFLGIEVSIDDKLSTMICMLCIDKMESWCSFKMSCCENQMKLQEWLKDWNPDDDSSDLNEDEDPIQEMDILKAEIDSSGHEPEITIKSEPMDEEDDDDDNNMYDLPPSLTPHPPELNTFDDLPNGTSVSSSIDSPLTDAEINKYDVPSRTCTICSKIFSTPGNRRKHEKTIHKINKNLTITVNRTGLQDEDSRTSAKVSEHSANQDNFIDVEKHKICSPELIEVNETNGKLEYTESDIQKIQFAAGLKLKQRNGTPNEICTLLGDSPLTKVEESYIIKCQKMVTMFSTLICSCHGYQHKTTKRLFAHLRSLSSWFPIYTCYNCVITYTDRSSNMKHTSKCPRKHLENLIKLSEMRRLTDFRIRLYQFSKCVKCNFVFGFHEDYCDHIDNDHLEDDLPIICTCGAEFMDPNEYKQHIYKSCMVNFHCDVCFEISPTLDEFKKHCEKVHDSEDGFQFLTNLSSSSEIKMDYDESFNNSFSQDEGETIECAPDLQLDSFDEANLEKVVNPLAFKNWPFKAECPVCGKAYSNYHNMLRHYKTHDDSEKHIPCSHCDEMFRLKTELKEHLIINHGIAEKSCVKNNSSLPCPECGIIFTNFEDWLIHKEAHGLPFTCGECGKQLTSKEELDQHRSTHLNIKLFRDSKTHAYRSTMLSPGSQELSEIEITEITDDKKGSEKKYSCESCDKTYSGYGGLWEHNKRYHPERRPSKDYPRQCKYCDKVLLSGGAYYMHKQMHERYAQPQLTIKQEPRKDVDSSEESTYFTCKTCFKVFSSKSNLKSHMKTHDFELGQNRSLLKTARLKTYWCNLCHQACSGYDELQKHKKEHANEKMPALIKLTEHTERDEHFCDICNKTFTAKSSLKKHKERHLDDHEDAKKAYIYCKYCKIPFADIAYLNSHIENDHRNEAPKSKQKNKNNKHVCGLCKKSFETSGALCSHQGWHKRVKYEQKMVYKTKPKQQPPPPPPPAPAPIAQSKFKCRTCFQSFINDTALQIHILEVHRQINAILINPRCSMCEIDFESQSVYEKHMELHKIVEKQNQQKAYSCKFCRMNFSRSDMLNAHIKTHHRELLPRQNFKCNQCGRSFEKQASLNAHMKAHDKQRNNSNNMGNQRGEKYNYTCSICHAGFNVPKDVRNHIIEAHPF